MSMHFKIVGGGPAGLYFAYLMKRSYPDYVIRVVEQNPPNATYGFGIVLSGRALTFLGQGDPAVIAGLTRRMERWSAQHIVHKDVRVVVDGSSFLAIGRLALLEELQIRCREAGVEIEFHRRMESSASGQDCDVLVAADGANSAIRDCHPAAFDTRIVELKNHFAWYGVEKPYDAHTLTFVQSDGFTFCAHHYRYTPLMSTFVAEVDAPTWQGSAMSSMTDDGRKQLFEDIFRDTLGDKKLISNRSLWHRWRLVTNGRWHYRNMVLIGDAQRSSHPSIGSGTRLAMEDSIALWRAFEAEGTDIGAAFERYQRERRPIRDKLNAAAERSIAWYENVGSKVALSPYDFAYDYLLRTGLMTRERLERESPRFMARYRENANSVTTP